MRKSIILSSLLFVSSLFADCPTGNGQVWVFQMNANIDYATSCGTCGAGSGCTVGNLYCGGTYKLETQESELPPNPYPGNCTYQRRKYVLSDSSCIASGATMQKDSTCYGGNSPMPFPSALHAHDGDESGCNGAGGYYMSGSCNNLQEAVQATFGDPQAVKGAFLAIGGAGVALTGVGLIGVSFGASAGMISAGAHAMVAGAGMIMGATPKVTGGTTSASNDMTSGSNRIKVNLTSSGGAGGTSSGSNVTSSNTTTGKVENSTFVPTSVQTALSNSANVTSSGETASLTTPISLAGVQSTNYDYATNTATTEYHLADSTSAVPHTATSSTSFSVTQNIDGSVTTVPTNTDLAPTVSGSGGGMVVSAPTATAGGTTTGTTIGTGTTTGTGSTTGTGGEYTAVLNDIKANTGASSGFLSDLLGKFTNSDAVDTTGLSDGSGDFGTLDGNVKGSYSGFVYTDPLGLNTLSGSAIPSYGFTLYGRHFVLMDQSMINQLPLDLMRNLFLFLAALAGLISVLSGV